MRSVFLLNFYLCRMAKDGTKKSKVFPCSICIKILIGILFLIALGSNKLTLIILIGKLRNTTSSFNNSSRNEIAAEEKNTAVTLYWYLQLILLVPNFITFLRCLVFGVLSKTTKNYPWPTKWAFFTVSAQNYYQSYLGQHFQLYIISYCC